ncbi:TetR/AcrR family transcriptional regulator [Maribacter sp.]|nr:TetR/AcrR family transcriptional regulator [Maribacter sp.]
MSDRKEQIIYVALELFANEGFKGVTTSKIAKQAGVSEGLIFRHFTNKQGLLEAITGLAVEKTVVAFKPIIDEKNAQKVIEKTILLPFTIKKDEYYFWKLQFKLKWEMEYSGKEKMKPLLDKLRWAFDELNYEQPEQEAEMLNHIVESVSGAILKDGLEGQLSLKDFLLHKYKITAAN